MQFGAQEIALSDRLT